MVPVGGSLLTGAGRLTGQGVRSILHVVPPVYADTEDACRAMAKAVGQVMETIKDSSVRSVAIPLLGAGKLLVTTVFVSARRACGH